jgi:alginate O-acetyltransferase complex protein AlgJ
MLSRYRRYLAIVAFLLLATPLIAGIVTPDSPDLILKEGRRMAAAPAALTTFEDWRSLPKEVDAYLEDRFGLRQKMIRLNKDLTKPMVAEGDPKVLIGRNGHMFLKLDSMVQQSAGIILRDRNVSETADTLASISKSLAQRAVKFLVAIPPNPSTIYPDDLPPWARSNGRKTEYDLMLEDLAARGVKTVDLRPVMTATRSHGAAYYQHDTHWTGLGALAAFNAIVEADSHPEWRVNPEAALAPTIRKGGDLVWLLGAPQNLVENAEDLTLHVNADTEKLAEGPTPVMPDQLMTSDKPGETVMVIGDSFTLNAFPPLLLQNVKRVVWLHHRWCAFQWKWIEEFHPDEVWWMPTERSLNCNPGARPIDFDGRSANQAAEGPH